MRKRLVSLTLLSVLAGLALGPSPQAARAEDPAADKYNAAELKELVGPVALYPDVVLASLLPATTFPDQVKAAAELVSAQGGKVEAVPEDKGWDGSVQALLQYPDVLSWLKDNGSWMEQMAFAVAVQQSEVLAAVQDFRKAAEDAGNLSTNQYQEVVVEGSGESEVIVIQPADPAVVYVPTYQPAAVTQPAYSGWAWGAGFVAGAATAWAFNEIGWGSGNDASINVNNSVNVNASRNTANAAKAGPNRASQWNASNRPSSKPGGAVAKPSTRPANASRATGPRPPGKAGGAGAAGRPGGVGGAGGARPPSRPATAPGAGARPTPSPAGGARPGGAGAPQRPSTSPGAGQRPASRSGGDAFGGSGGSANQARAQSQRGNSSMRSGGGGGGRSGGGGGGRGGGGGGGGRRR